MSQAAQEQALEALIREQKLNTAPRVTPEQVDAMVKTRELIVIDDVGAIVLYTLHNGMKVLGKNLGSISPANFSMDIAKAKADDDARAQLWPIAGAILAEDLYRGNMPLTDEQRALPAHVQRVLVEMYQVASRLLGLTEFLTAYDAETLDGEIVKNLSADEVADLRLQHGLMKEYVQVLQRRLERAGV